MSKKVQRYAMLVVRLPEDQSDVGLGHDTMLKCGEVVASCKRPLSTGQVAAVVKAMDGADAYVPGPTSGQDALGLSTRENQDVAPSVPPEATNDGQGLLA